MNSKGHTYMVQIPIIDSDGFIIGFDMIQVTVREKPVVNLKDMKAIPQEI